MYPAFGFVLIIEPRGHHEQDNAGTFIWFKQDNSFVPSTKLRIRIVLTLNDPFVDSPHLLVCNSIKILVLCA